MLLVEAEPTVSLQPADSDNCRGMNVSYSQGGIECPIQDQRRTLMGNGRLRNQCGTTFPMPPMRTARPRAAIPDFLNMSIVMVNGAKCQIQIFQMQMPKLWMAGRKWVSRQFEESITTTTLPITYDQTSSEYCTLLHLPPVAYSPLKSLQLVKRLE